jgi:hypothetical protein
MCSHIYAAPPGNPYPASAPLTDSAPFMETPSFFTALEKIIQTVSCALIITGTTIDEGTFYESSHHNYYQFLIGFLPVFKMSLPECQDPG